MNRKTFISRLPFDTQYAGDSKKARGLRIGLTILVAVILLVPAVQLQVINARNRLDPDRKASKGAMDRFCRQVRMMWDGHNIYMSTQEQRKLVAAGEMDPKLAKMHPNSPFVLIFLTPFAYMPWWLCTPLLTLIKLACLLFAMIAAASICNDGEKKMPDWVVGLGVAWAAMLLIADIQHSALNGLTLGAIALHLWFYRRGRDVASGWALAAAIWLKMTPALFLIYWLYQRDWKLLMHTAIALLVTGVAVPAILIGPAQFQVLMTSWLQNLVFKGASGDWYPMHVNQSLLGVVCRFFIGPENPAGNIFNDPEVARANIKGYHWITIVDLGPLAAAWIYRIGQFAIVGAMAWAIGWKKLAREDGRRGLHYAMILSGLLLLNQRTWDHHAAVLLPGYVAIWYAIAYGGVGLTTRRVTFGLMMAAGVFLWLSTGELLKVYGKWFYDNKKLGADIILAWGPRFFSFLLMWLAAVVLCLKLNKADQPYGRKRRTLGSN